MLAIAALLADGEDPEAIFTGGYGPVPLTDSERAAIAAKPAPPPSWVEGEYPEWLESELSRAFAHRLPEEMAAFQNRAPVDLRVNTPQAAAVRDDVANGVASAAGISGTASRWTMFPTPFAAKRASR